MFSPQIQYLPAQVFFRYFPIKEFWGGLYKRYWASRGFLAKKVYAPILSRAHNSLKAIKISFLFTMP